MVELRKSGRILARVEGNGINVIADAERKGRPSQLFWPWFARQRLGARPELRRVRARLRRSRSGRPWSPGIVGIVFSFLLCGFIALAGKRGSAPTMVLSRAAFGVRGNKLPSVISWLLTVGWETVLAILATLATATVFDRLGLGRRHRHEGGRAGRGGRADRRRRRARLRPDHAAADGHHGRHRRC